MPPRNRSLRPVPAAGEPEPEQIQKPKRPATVAEAAAVGTRRDLLVAQRARLAKAIDDDATRPRELAQLSRQLSLVDQEIRTIDLAAGNDPIGRAAHTPDEPWDASAI
ncbi:hypothetical protein [Nocardia gipuzkoensis]